MIEAAMTSVIKQKQYKSFILVKIYLLKSTHTSKVILYRSQQLFINSIKIAI
jgi:hypothetical protein